MNAARRRIVCNASKLFDLMVVAVSLALAAVTGMNPNNLASVERVLALQVSVRHLVLFLGFMVVAHLVFVTFRLYDSKRLSSRRSESLEVIAATLLATLVLALGRAVVRSPQIDAAFLAVFWGATTVCLVAARLVVRAMLAAVRRRGRNTRHMLIVGTNARALEFARKIEASPELGYQIVGFSDAEWGGSSQLVGKSVVCDLASLGEYLRLNVVDEVVLALPVGSFHQYCSQIISRCEEQGIITRFLPDLFNLRDARSRVEAFDSGEAVITLYAGNGDGWPVMMKRALDCVLSLCLIILSSPVLVVAALAVKLTSPGPVLFVQQRLGLNKRRFRMFKFRTMCADAEQRFREVEHLNELTGPVFKIKNDPRITPVGRFLRKASIDELPQLFNVLKGDMSLVGPRPLDVRDYDLMTQSCEDWQRCRFSVRPGITCLWQVNGRNSLAFEQWMELDRQYVLGWSLWLDFKILFRTIPVVLKGSGAA